MRLWLACGLAVLLAGAGIAADQVVIRPSPDPDLGRPILPSPQITTSTIPNATQNAACSVTFATDGAGAPPYTWEYLNGTFPTGTTLNAATGTLSGTCTVAGSFSFAVRVVDTALGASSRSFVWTVTAVSSGTTRNVACSGTITTAMNSAISASANGDTVAIGAGSCTMGRLNLWSNKSIWIHGASKATTIITANSGFSDIESTGSTVPGWHLSDMTLTSTGNPGGPIVQIWADQSSTWRGPFHIDHVTMNYPAGGAGIYVNGMIYGLIDHVDCSLSFESCILTSPTVNTEGASLPNLKGAAHCAKAFSPGGSDNLVIEDSTFTGIGSAGFAVLDTGYSGGRIIFRHNTMSNSALYAHWTSGDNVNCEWIEVYNNVMDWTGGIIPPVLRLQGGGTGLIYNNTITGFSGNYRIQIGEGRREGQGSAPTLTCDGTHNWDGNAGDASAAGWPCLAQTGRAAGVSIATIQAGTKQASFPLYLWNNGTQAKCSDPAAAGSACTNTLVVAPNDTTYFKTAGHTVSGGGFGQGDVDYSVTATQPAGAGTHTLTYTPLTYPHPLNRGP